MKILEKIIEKSKNSSDAPNPTIAFIGDSVTQGCFELIPRNDEGFINVHDRENAYHAVLARMLSALYPEVPVNIINAGAAGKTAKHGLERIERDVLSKNPDLTVVCFGLNDCGAEDDGIEEYIASLRAIFKKLRDAGSEIIFMTPNMMSTKVSPTIDKAFIELAGILSDRQNRGVLDRYIDAAKALCEEENIPVCDCYAKWKKLEACGVDTTELLANKLNHPTREMHKLFATSLMEMIMR